MIRVIHYCPSINCTSGITNLIMNYYRKIDRNKIQFDFVYFSNKTNNNYENEIKELGGSTTYIEPPTKFRTFKKNFNKFLKKIKEQYPNDDLIFQNHQLAFMIFMYRILKKNNINRIIVHNHMTKFSDSKIKAFRNMILFLPVRFMKLYYFSCSEEACKLICNYANQKRNNIFIMNNGIDCEKFKYDKIKRIETRNKLKISNDSIVIGHIGHFEPVKNHNFIIEIFKEIIKIKENATLLLIGSGKLKHMVEKKINSEELTNNVIILENRKDIPDLLNAMDLFIFPSKFEGLGIVAIEAQASGLKVIMSDKVPSETNIVNCKVLEIDSKKQWIDTIMKSSIENSYNREYANSIVKKSKFNISNNVNEIERIYMNMLK